MNSTNKVILMILDGWGIGKGDSSDAIRQANTPFIDGLAQSKPHSKLKTFGENVGLPQGQMGNSEVGHMNIGAGRIVWQMLVKVNKAFREGSVTQLDAFKELVSLAEQEPERKIHLMGLVSKGGVHSSQEHLLELTQLLANAGLDQRTFIHAFTDGRDTDPNSGIDFIKEVESDPRLNQSKMATICGRYYAMDRDKRWERTHLAYQLLVDGKGKVFNSSQEAIQASYDDGITDEFIKPCVIDVGEDSSIEPGDIVLCFNFRTDRARQITRVLTQENIAEYGMNSLDLHYFTLTTYDKSFEGIKVLFEDQDLVNTLGEILAKNSLKQLRAAETEKYPHVTFFFNGGREEPFDGENRLLVNSPKVATYDLQPEMSAPELTHKLKEAINSEVYDFICVNYANPDMVGHTGVFSAIIKACETVDRCANEVVQLGIAKGYSFIIIADHGNADKAVNEDGSPNTAHTTNLVPCYVLSPGVSELRDGILADISPTVLDLMNLEPPDEMSGQSLIHKKGA